MVEFVDGSLLAQLSVTDMRLPILYALTWPERIASDLRFPVLQMRRLDFRPPDLEKFPCLRLAYEAAEAGGSKTHCPQRRRRDSRNRLSRRRYRFFSHPQGNRKYTK